MEHSSSTSYRKRSIVAVVVIHGIGERQPMDTLRGFASTLIGHRFMSKPDRVSGLDLRRLRGLKTSGDRETDFYEFYWAHHIRGTTWTHVFHWLITMLPCKPTNRLAAYRRLIRMWWSAWALVMIAVALGLASLAYLYQNPVLESLLAIIFGGGLATVLCFIGFLLSPVLRVVGDAARYLDCSPENVAERQEVINEGVTLLTGLHRDPQIDRIVVVGHSLGSVIGYDILKRFWMTVHTKMIVDAETEKLVRTCCASCPDMSRGSTTSMTLRRRRIKRSNTTSGSGSGTRTLL